MSTTARTSAALATTLLLGAFAPWAMTPASAAGASHAAGSGASDSYDRGGKDWHLTAALGKGPWKVRFYTCNSVDQYGNITFRFRATTRKSTDDRYPRINLDLADGTYSREFSLFPGDRTVTESEPYMSAAALAHLSLHNQGKSKKKDFTIGEVLPC